MEEMRETWIMFTRPSWRFLSSLPLLPSSGRKSLKTWDRIVSASRKSSCTAYIEESRLYIGTVYVGWTEALPVLQGIEGLDQAHGRHQRGLVIPLSCGLSCHRMVSKIHLEEAKATNVKYGVTSQARYISLARSQRAI